MINATIYNSGVSSQVNRWFKVAMFNFLLAACIGLLLRFAFVSEIEWLDYKSFQNAHSTLALLGWGYLGFFALMIRGFGPLDEKELKRISVLFWISEVLILLIAIGFAGASNKLIPNIFAIILSFVVFMFVFRFINATKNSNRDRSSYHFLIAALIFLSLSFVGTYVMVYSLLISHAKKILLYYLSSQFFLHMQYNGWFTFAGLALFFRWAEEKGIILSIDNNKKILIGLITGVILTFFISLFWGNQTKMWLLAIAGIGGIIQIITLVKFRKYLIGVISELLKTMNRHFRALFFLALICFCLKLVMQTIIIFPFIATLAFTIRNYVIAYIHLVFIGMTSLYILIWAIEHKFVDAVKLVRVGIFAVVVGFILVELLLFIQGTLLWTGKGFLSFYYPLVFGLNIFLPIGLLIIILKNFKYLPFKNQSP